MKQAKALVAVGASIVIALGGACSGGEEGGPAAPARSAAISLRGLAFSPSEVTIASGGSVTWTDEEAVEHTVTAGTPDAPDKARFHHVLMNTQTFTHTFSSSGAYSFFCERHPANMRGSVTVR